MYSAIVRIAVRIAVLIGVWWVTCLVFDIAPYILPAPIDVAMEFVRRPALYLAHSGVTFAEAIVGLLIATTLSAGLALALYANKTARTIVEPYLLAVQATPILAVAPLLVVWLGPGFASKVACSLIVCFFPILVSTSEGLRLISRDEREYYESLGATKMDILMNVRIRHALPYFFSGLKVACPLSVIGAIVGEFVGSAKGLGYLVLTGSYYLKTAMMFGAIICSVMLSIVLMKTVSLVFRKVAFWSFDGETQQ